MTKGMKIGLGIAAGLAVAGGAFAVYWFFIRKSELPIISKRVYLGEDYTVSVTKAGENQRFKQVTKAGEEIGKFVKETERAIYMEDSGDSIWVSKYRTDNITPIKYEIK